MDPRGDLTAGQAEILQGEGDVVVDGAGDDSGVGALTDVGDGLGQGLDSGVCDLGAVQAQAAGVLRGQAVRDETAQGTHQRGLAAARRTDDGCDPTAQVGEAHRVQNPALASEVVDTEPLDPHQGRSFRPAMRLFHRRRVGHGER